MPQISPTEFRALPLRVHTFLADVPLHDVWAVDLPMHRDGVTLSEFLRRTSQGGINRLPPVAHALICLRLFLGRIFRLEAEPKDALAASFGSRLRQRIVLVLLSLLERQKDCSALSIASKTNNYLKYRIVPSMLRPSVPSLKGPKAIDSTLRSMCARERGLRRSTCA